MNPIETQLKTNLADVTGRINAACARVGRSTDDVTLVAVTKYAREEWVRGLVALGVQNLGESRPQQLLERVSWFDDSASYAPSVRWHLIGHLQRNKARKMLPVTWLVHSTDSVRLLSALDRIASEENIRPSVLLEVNVSGEKAKDGFEPEDLSANWERITAMSHIEITGLMTMAPRTDDSEAARPYFRRLRELRDRLSDMSPYLSLPELSMGMSGDFEVALEEGATIVRIGSRLYQGLESP